MFGGRFEAPWARVITGEDEGTYGWIALNYLAGRLASGSSSNIATADTLGALDLGGSSLEVTFASDASGAPERGGGKERAAPVCLLVCAARRSEPSLSDPSSARLCAVNVSVLGTTHAVYSHVHHHFGLDDAWDRAVSLLLAEAGVAEGAAAAPRIEHPCLQVGKTLHYSRRTMGSAAPIPATVELSGRCAPQAVRMQRGLPTCHWHVVISPFALCAVPT